MSHIQELFPQSKQISLLFDEVKEQNSLKLITETKISLIPIPQGQSDEDNTYILDYLENQNGSSINLDDSIEMAMMQLTIEPANRREFEKEREITQYLKSSGVIIKTDPRSNCKEEVKIVNSLYFIIDEFYFQEEVPSEESPLQKSDNSQILTPLSGFMSLQNNSIMQRRTPTNSPSHQNSQDSKLQLSFDLTKPGLKQDQGKKSLFFMYQQQE